MIIGVNRILNLVQIISGGRRYTCPMVKLNGVDTFRFKNKIYNVADHVSEHTTELLYEGKKVISRLFKK